jgi:hypothetical protein
MKYDATLFPGPKGDYDANGIVSCIQMGFSADLNIKNEAGEWVRCGVFIQRQRVNEDLNMRIFFGQVGGDQVVYVAKYFRECIVQSLVSIEVFSNSF